MPKDYPLRVLTGLEGLVLGDVRGKILVTFRQFPFGYESDYWDICSSTYELLLSDWITYSHVSSEYSYSDIDIWQQRDTWDYVDMPNGLTVHDVKEYMFRLDAINLYG